MSTMKKTLISCLVLSLFGVLPEAVAGPTGGQVVAGSAKIHQSGANTVINQSSNRAIINWKNFDIGKNEAVRHQMPSSNAAALHRVVGGGGASQIKGLLQSNGNIYVVNPAGVVLHKGSRVNTNSFIATSRDISNDNFMNGNMVFDKPGRSDAIIINLGEITVNENGLALLVAPTVRNEGVIVGKLAKVALASGDSAWKLDMYGDDLITFTVRENDVDGLYTTEGEPLSAGVENTGQIKAEGGVVILSAAQLDKIVSSVVNSGTIDASSAEMIGGKIVFKGDGNTQVVNSGTVNVSSQASKGGSVEITGSDITLAENTNISASGKTGGGTVLVGGDWQGTGDLPHAQTVKMESKASIHADATTSGDGGKVVLWSDGTTRFDGTITAQGGAEGGDGGKIETSAASLKIGDAVNVDTSAQKGKTGEWLLDPTDFTIAAEGGDVSGDMVSWSLAKNNVIIGSWDGKTEGEGNINVNQRIRWSSDNTLTLDAENNININANITATGDRAGLVINPANGDYWITNASINLTGETPSLLIAGKEYTVINSVQELQDMKNKLSGNYALGSDIDASETAKWNNGAGFLPIGYSGTHGGIIFSGQFHGLGHIIHDLKINRPTGSNATGLFGYIRNAVIRDVGIENALIIGRFKTGALIGYSKNSIISNSYSSGNVKGSSVVGGLVGLAQDNTRISNSYSLANINTSDTGGGFIGQLKSGSITSSFAIGKVNSGQYIGGFIARNAGTIMNCYSAGAVQNSIISGGFVGQSQGTVINSYTIGKITFIPWYDHGDGFSPGLGSGSYGNYWNGSISNYSRSGIKLTDSQMKKQSSYSGWDFDNVWMIDEGLDYPRLRKVATFLKLSSEEEPLPSEPQSSPEEEKDIFSQMNDVFNKTEKETRNLGDDPYTIIENQQQKNWMDTNWKISNYTKNVNPILFEYVTEIKEINSQYLKHKIFEKAVTDALKTAAKSVVANIILPGAGLAGALVDTVSFASVSNTMLNVFKDKDLWQLYIKQLFVDQCLENFKLNYQQAEAIINNHPEGLDPQRALRVAELYKIGSEYLAIASYYSTDAINYYQEDHKLSSAAINFTKTFIKTTYSDLAKYEYAEQFTADFIDKSLRKLDAVLRKIKSPKVTDAPESLVKAIDVINDANEIAWTVKDKTENFREQSKIFKNNVTSAFKLISIVKNMANNKSDVLVDALGIKGLNDRQFNKIPNEIILSLKGQK